MDRINLAKSPFHTPISAALSGGLVRRSRTQRSNREDAPAISRAISAGGERNGHVQFVGVPNEIKLYAAGEREHKIRGERAQVKR